VSTTPAWHSEPDQALSKFGTCVAVAGNVNGDGSDDIIVGAPYYDGLVVNQGRAYLFYGSATSFSMTGAGLALVYEGNGRTPSRLGKPPLPQQWTTADQPIEWLGASDSQTAGRLVERRLFRAA
jgi:hypothetical protein